MRTYVVFARGRVVGTIEAPSDREAAYLVVTMWGGQTTMKRATEAAPWDVYEGLRRDECADFAGGETEIMWKIAREG